LVRDWHVGETGRETLQNLLLSLIDEEELHVAADCIGGSLVYSDKIAPFFGGIDSVVHNLALAELGVLLEDLGWSFSAIDVGMINTGLPNNSKSIFLNPFPESHSLIDLALLHFRFCVQVENLDNCLSALSRSQCDDVLCSMHKDSLGLHWLPLKSKIFRRVNDGTISLILDTNVLLTLKCDRSKFKEIRIESQIG